ncbi:MAG: 3-dehydroquinate synthase [Bacteroidota bacterium]
MIDYPIQIGDDSLQKLSSKLQESSFSQILVLVDSNTKKNCYPILSPLLPPHQVVEILPGEIHKTLDTCSFIWEKMTQLAFDRKGLVLNLGGGVIGDMGGFVAGTYKRGIDFIQIPTTLLSQVDASVGGKLGIDFQGFKNHIGLFKEPLGVYIYPSFLDTLSDRELRSGFAEVIKHHLIGDAPAWERLQHQKELRQLDFAQLIEHSVQLKSHIVEIDPFEHGLRKALNFGHTIGHAIESFRLEGKNPLLHGEAIAAGMICESYISYQKGLLSEAACTAITDYILSIYDFTPLSSANYEEIFGRMKNDKKNRQGKILCTLLDGIGQVSVNQEIAWQEMESSLNYYQSLHQRA